MEFQKVSSLLSEVSVVNRFVAKKTEYHQLLIKHKI